MEEQQQQQVTLSGTADGPPFTVVCDGSDPDDPRWLEARNATIGASESPTVLGLDPFGSTLSLWARKVGIEPPLDLSDKEAVFWGRQLEASIIAGYGARTGRQVVGFGLLLRSTRWPWLSATPDAMATDDDEADADWLAHAIDACRACDHETDPEERQLRTADLWAALDGWWPLQTKNVGLRMAPAWEDGIPEHYLSQVEHEALVMGCGRGTGAALIGGQQLVWDDLTDIGPATATGQRLINRTRLFWYVNVADKVQPPADGSADARKLLEKWFPRQDPNTIIRLPMEAMRWADELDELKNTIREAKGRADELENLIRQQIGKNELGVLPDGSGWSYKVQQKKSFVVAASESRVLRRTKAKKGQQS